ncbi:hypothetical protein H6F88_18005 [Oculatella sp. FACHB-28]|uniref:hypothetical protein n=1 Tax=Oculatella sp. FACHB-28 TaxID=2692845 RepID=UPI001682363B|nr:hypothetical protein [Oculatella sp. FACHB-28]MBD2057890.1 hypothetical protein [Oculatella sp. FACHB-28]
MAFNRKAKTTSGNTTSAAGTHQTPFNRNKSNSFGSNSENLWFLRLIYWLAFSVGVVIALFNIIPYVKSVKFLFGTAIDGSGILELISQLPLINAVAGVSIMTALWVIGIIFWAFLQAAELFETFLKRNRAFVGHTIDDAVHHQKYAISEQDDPLLAGLKRLYNRMPLLTMHNARQTKLVAYTIDLCVCLTIYPPVDGGFGRLMIVLLTGQWSLIDWANVAALVATLFVVEWIVNFLFWVSDIIRFVKVGVKLQ